MRLAEKIGLQKVNSPHVLVTFATFIRVLYKNNSILNAITGFEKHQIFVDDDDDDEKI